MAKKTRLKFNAKAWGRHLFNQLAPEQTRRLIAYAKVRIDEIGASIEAFPDGNNMDRTGNLLDSLCWAVYYNGSKKGFGYYRKPQAVIDSALHEWFAPPGEDVNGRYRAQMFLQEYNPETKKGWELFFAILAPYWGYWEKGHVNVRNSTTQKWSVMATHYDFVMQDLTPTKVTFKNYVPNY